MKRAFLVSVWFHLVMIVLVVVPTLHLGRRLLRPSAYHVRVVELPVEPVPVPPQPVPPPRVPPAPPRPAKPPARPKITPPKPKAVTPLPPLKPKHEMPPPPEPKPEALPVPPTPPVPPAPQAPALMVQPKIDMPEFDCANYCTVLQRKLEGQWVPPPVSAQGPVQAVVVFTINRDGSVDNLALENSSGNFYFDQAALRAVQLARPLPPLPRTLNSSTLRVHVPFTWQGGP